jgi:hypothetical protein
MTDLKHELATSAIDGFNLGLAQGRKIEREAIIHLLEHLNQDPSQVNLTGAIQLLKGQDHGNS